MNDLLAELLEQLLSIVVEVTAQIVDHLVLDDVETTLGLSNQPLVVSDNNHAALVLCDGLGERVNRLEVQVVGRLVQDYNIGRLARQVAQSHARLLTTRQVFDFDLVRVSRQTNASQSFSTLLIVEVVGVAEMFNRANSQVELVAGMLIGTADFQEPIWVQSL